MIAPSHRRHNRVRLAVFSIRWLSVILFVCSVWILELRRRETWWPTQQMSEKVASSPIESILAASMKEKTSAHKMYQQGRQQSPSDFLANLDQLSPRECPPGFVRMNDTHIPSSHYTTTQRIPKIVFQTSKSRCLPTKIIAWTELWRFKEWSYYFFDDDAMMRFIREYSADFPHLPMIAEHCALYGTLRADLWRYLVLWKYGGIYADLDTVPTNFTPALILPEDDAFFVVEYYHLLSQYFMAISPRHPLVHYALHMALANVLTAEDTGEVNAAYETGPHALHMAFQQFRRDVGASVRSSTSHPIVAGRYSGSMNRSVTVVGEGFKQSNDIVQREKIRKHGKLKLFEMMNMTHNQADKDQRSGQSCFAALLKGQKGREITDLQKVVKY